MTDTIDIPGTAFIQCPKTQFRGLVSGAKCAQCEHHLGLKEIEGNEQAGFVRRYRVVCAHPIARQMIELEV